MATSAWGTAAPLGSVTVPMMLPDTACPNPACLKTTDSKTIVSTTRTMLLREVILRSSTSNAESRPQQAIAPARGARVPALAPIQWPASPPRPTRGPEFYHATRASAYVRPENRLESFGPNAYQLTLHIGR